MIALEGLVFEFEGYIFHIKAQLEGRNPFYRAGVRIESLVDPSYGCKETGIRYDRDKGVFLDFLLDLAGEPDKTTSELQQEARLKVSEIFTTLERNGYITISEISKMKK